MTRGKCKCVKKPDGLVCFFRTDVPKSYFLVKLFRILKNIADVNNKLTIMGYTPNVQ